MYIILSFLTGISIVLNMVVNGKVAQRMGMITSILLNYLIATLSSIIICSIMLESIYVNWLRVVSIVYYVGGVIGVFTTYAFNRIVLKVPAVYIVIFRFIGQMFTSAIIDYMVFGIFSKGKVLGALFFLIGLMINAKADKIEQVKCNDGGDL